MENHLTAAIVSNDVLFQQQARTYAVTQTKTRQKPCSPTHSDSAIGRRIHHIPTPLKQHQTQQMLASTVNGTTYCGIRARTTGAPQNHWCVTCYGVWINVWVICRQGMHGRKRDENNGAADSLVREISWMDMEVHADSRKGGRGRRTKRWGGRGSLLPPSPMKDTSLTYKNTTTNTYDQTKQVRPLR